jgi:hypothetical protein
MSRGSGKSELSQGALRGTLVLGPDPRINPHHPELGDKRLLDFNI